MAFEQVNEEEDIHGLKEIISSLLYRNTMNVK